MLRRTMAAALLAGGLVMTAGPVERANAAVPLAKVQSNAKADVIKVRRGWGGGGGSFRGFSGGSFRGFQGGSFRGFRGNNFGGFRGGISRGWNGGISRGWNGGNRWVNRGWNGNRHSGHRHRGWRHRHYGYRRWYGPGIYVGTYGSSCGWLYRRAVRTGSPYWWRRYEECRYGWY